MAETVNAAGAADTAAGEKADKLPLTEENVKQTL